VIARLGQCGVFVGAKKNRGVRSVDPADESSIDSLLRRSLADKARFMSAGNETIGLLGALTGCLLTPRRRGSLRRWPCPRRKQSARAASFRPVASSESARATLHIVDHLASRARTERASSDQPWRPWAGCRCDDAPVAGSVDWFCKVDLLPIAGKSTLRLARACQRRAVRPEISLERSWTSPQSQSGAHGRVRNGREPRRMQVIHAGICPFQGADAERTVAAAGLRRLTGATAALRRPSTSSRLIVFCTPVQEMSPTARRNRFPVTARLKIEQSIVVARGDEPTKHVLEASAFDGARRPTVADEITCPNSTLPDASETACCRGRILISFPVLRRSRVNALCAEVGLDGIVQFRCPDSFLATQDGRFLRPSVGKRVPSR